MSERDEIRAQRRELAKELGRAVAETHELAAELRAYAGEALDGEQSIARLDTGAMQGCAAKLGLAAARVAELRRRLAVLS